MRKPSQTASPPWTTLSSTWTLASSRGTRPLTQHWVPALRGSGLIEFGHQSRVQEGIRRPRGEPRGRVLEVFRDHVLFRGRASPTGGGVDSGIPPFRPRSVFRPGAELPSHDGRIPVESRSVTELTKGAFWVRTAVGHCTRRWGVPAASMRSKSSSWVFIAEVPHAGRVDVAPYEPITAAGLRNRMTCR